MGTKMITLRLGIKLLVEIDNVLKNTTFKNRTEFVTDALRKSLHEAQIQRAINHYKSIQGMGRTNSVTPEEYEKVREGSGLKYLNELKKLKKIPSKN